MQISEVSRITPALNINRITAVLQPCKIRVRTGIHSEMRTVVNEFHKANLAVLNLGPNPGIFLSGAHAMNELVRPASVIITHPNEPVTEGGKLRPLSRSAAVIRELKAPAHLAISGRTMEFDGKGRCVAGC